MRIEPQSASVVLKKDDHIQSVEFEIGQRPPGGQDVLEGGCCRRDSGSALQHESRLRRNLVG
jgi:hypothetical protein